MHLIKNFFIIILCELNLRNHPNSNHLPLIDSSFSMYKKYFFNLEYQNSSKIFNYDNNL